MWRPRANMPAGSRRLAVQVESTLLPIMRVYFEKPRTTVGWKGLINDPDLDDSFHIEKGILMARELLLHVAELGLPAGTEALDPIMPQYLSELITWTAIGARTTESQTHREMASGLSTPVGFKNGTDGSLATSINALQSVRHPHHFLGITQQGQSAVFRTRGNGHAHLVLRGGGGRVNYDAVSIALAERELAAAALPATIVVDCSHGNSNKDPSLQPLVAENCITQIADGNRSIVGLMLESHLKARQPIDSEGLEQARVRHVHHRSLHRLADHREPVAQAPSVLASRAALTRASDRRCFQRRYPSRSVSPHT